MRTLYSLRALGFLIALLIVAYALASQLGAFDSDGDKNTVADSDLDTFSNAIEEHTGTDPLDACPDHASDSAWPPDFNNDSVVNDADLSLIKDALGRAGEIVPARSDLDSDGAITGADLAAVASRIGTSCER